MNEIFKQVEGLIGKPVTIFKISEWGMQPQVFHSTVTGVQIKDYAQYRNMVHIEHKLKGKRTKYVIRVYPHSEILIYEGWIEIAEKLWVTTIAEGPGVIVREIECCCNETCKKVYEAIEQKPIVNIQPMVYESN